MCVCVCGVCVRVCEGDMAYSAIRQSRTSAEESHHVRPRVKDAECMCVCGVHARLCVCMCVRVYVSMCACLNYLIFLYTCANRLYYCE